MRRLLALLATIATASATSPAATQHDGTGVRTMTPRFRQKMRGDPHHRLGQARSRSAGAPPPAMTLRIQAFGGDPTGVRDSADAFDAALAAAWARAGGLSPHNFTDGPDLGGVIVDLEGGQYGISRPIVMPKDGGGNVNIVDGSLRALPAFGAIGTKDPQAFLIRFDRPATSWACEDVGPGGLGSCNWYTYIRFENLVLDAQLRGGCVKVAHSTRITIAETFVTGFSSIGVWAAQPNEDVVLIDSFLGTFDWRSKRCLDSHEMRTIAVQFDGPDNLITNAIMFCSGLGISSAGVNVLNQVHIFTGTSYALDRVADPPIGALWVRGMEYIGNGTGALHGGHKVHTVRITESYFDYAAVWLDDPMEVSFDSCYFLGNPGGAPRLPGQPPATPCAGGSAGHCYQSVCCSQPRVASDPNDCKVCHGAFITLAATKFGVGLSKGELFGLSVRNSFFDWGPEWYTNESIGRAAIVINETEGEFDRQLIVNTAVTDNTFTGARGVATKLSRSLRQENATVWHFDLCDSLLLPPRLGTKENVFQHVRYSIEIEGASSFARHKLAENSGCVVTVATDEPVTGTVYIDVDQSSQSMQYVPQTPALKTDAEVPLARIGCAAHGLAGGWQFGAWGTQAFITRNGTHLAATVSAADANNSGTRFFPGGWRVAHGEQHLGTNTLTLTFDNGTTIEGTHDNNCETITWPDTSRWYRLPEFHFVKKVHVVQSCHLDIGFANTSVSIINRYVGKHGYFETAPLLSEALRKRNEGASYVFLTQSWLVQLFLNCNESTFPHLSSSSDQLWRDELDCPSPERIAAFEAAVRCGDISWHMAPFDAQPELLDAALFRWGLENITHAMDHRFGLPPKRVLSQRDVPGMSRGVVPALVAAGGLGVQVGVNTNSAPPAVPGVLETATIGAPARVFRWRDEASGTEILSSWHAGGYGGHGGQNIYAKTEAGNCIVVDGFEEALCQSWMGDNAGPPPGRGQLPLDIEAGVAVVSAHWQAYRAIFPAAATIQGSSFEDFWLALNTSTARSSLPVWSGESGDTWIYGAASDPFKLAALRVMQRVRAECVRAPKTPSCSTTELQRTEFDSFLFLLSKHTWGRGCAASGVNTSWSNGEFDRTRATEDKTSDSSFASCERGWDEQRLQLSKAVESVRGSAFGTRVAAEMAALRPATPQLSGYKAVPKSNWTALHRLSPSITVGFDRVTGAIINLMRGTKRFASPEQKLVEVWYKTNDRAEELSMSANYSVTIPDPWSNKKGVAGGLGVRNWPNDSSAGLSESRVWRPTLTAMYSKSSPEPDSSTILIELTMPSVAATQYGCPKTVWVSVAAVVLNDERLNDERSVLNVTVIALEKRGTRLPEQMWIGFSPLAGLPAGRAAEWQMDKMGTRVSFAETVKNGSKYLHGIGHGGVTLEQQAASAAEPRRPLVGVQSLDAALVAPRGQARLPNFESGPIGPASDGVAFNLFNNMWLCNYIMWYPWQPQPGAKMDDAGLTLPVYRFLVSMY